MGKNVPRKRGYQRNLLLNVVNEMLGKVTKYQLLTRNGVQVIHKNVLGDNFL